MPAMHPRTSASSLTLHRLQTNDHSQVPTAGRHDYAVHAERKRPMGPLLPKNNDSASKVIGQNQALGQVGDC